MTPPAWTPATTSVNGIRLHHRVAGSGPPVVLLHGWPQDGRGPRRRGTVMASLPILDLWREYHDDPDLVGGRAIEGGGHFVPEEAAGELIDELRPFLSGV